MDFSFFTDCNEFFIDRLLNREINLSVRHIIITPKAYTLHFEKLLSARGGYFDIDVLSFSRLYYKLGGGALLPYESAVMEIKRILNRLDLSCFNRSKNYAGFCKKMLDSIYRLIESGIKPEDLPKNNYKFRDLSLVYREFLNKNKGKVLADISNLIGKSDFFKNAHVYALNFASFTREELKALDLIKSKALSLTIPNVKIPLISDIEFKNAEIYASCSKSQAVKACAKRITLALYNGVRLDEMCLVCDQRSFDTVKRVLNDYSIEHYCNFKESVLNMPFCRFIMLLLKFDGSKRHFILLSKSVYSGIDIKSSANFENYCNRFNIERGFNKQFNLGEGDFLLNAENVRRELVNLVFEFRQGIKNNPIEYLRDFISKFEGDDSKIRMIQLLNVLADSLNLGEDEDFVSLFCEALGASYLRPLPMDCECLLVSSADSFRGKKFKNVFILDFNEGIMPKNITEFGVMDSKESSLISLCPTMDSLKQNTLNDLAELIFKSDNAFLCYVRTQADRPSPMLYTIREVGKNITLNRYDKEMERVYEGSDFDFLTDYACNLKSSLEHLLSNLERGDVFNACLYELTKSSADKIILSAKNNIKNINFPIFDLKTVSASRLSTYFSCPYKHFIKYGLKAKENESGSINPLDTGLIVHKVAEEFFLSNFNEDKLDNIINKTVEEYAHKIDEIIRARLIEEIKSLCLRLKRNLTFGRFEPLGAEIKLYGGSLKHIEIDGTKLVGSIDYADVYENYVRIIDYKSGARVGFDNKELYYGLKLQLPLYMGALIFNGYYPAGMFYFPFRLSFNSDNRFIGVFNNTPRIVFAFDNSLSLSESEKVESCVFEGGIKYSKEIKAFGSGGKSQEKIEELCNYALSLANLAIKQIKSGYIEPSPFSLSYSCCDYCDYKIACKSYKIRKRIL